MMKTCILRILIVVKREDEGYCGFCPDLGCINVYGDSREEALVAAKDAIGVYLDMSIAHGDPIPIGIVHSHRESFAWLWRWLGIFTRSRREFVEDVAFATA